MKSRCGLFCCGPSDKLCRLVDNQLTLLSLAKVQLTQLTSCQENPGLLFFLVF